jgi:hypothetical protein
LPKRRKPTDSSWKLPATEIARFSLPFIEE